MAQDVCSLKVDSKILVAEPQWGKASRIILSNPEEEEYSHPMSLDKSDPHSRSQSHRPIPILVLQRPALIYVFPADLHGSNYASYLNPADISVTILILWTP